jgi:hypothetical protein
LIISDGESFEASNVNRVYGLRVVDDTVAKVKIAQRLAADIVLGTKVELVEKPVSYQSALKRFRDIVFGCIDDELGRSLLNSFAIYYYVPVFDMGVKIDSNDGVIRSIQGRVTILMNGAACLHCRSRISAERVAAQAQWEAGPEGAQALQDEGYLPELGDAPPAVVAFTTAVAASAITEFLHRLTGFHGAGSGKRRGLASLRPGQDTHKQHCIAEGLLLRGQLSLGPGRRASLPRHDMAG